MRINCENCAHYRIDMSANGPQAGQSLCGVEPPKVFPLPAPGGISIITIWPQVRAGDRCGKFARSVESIERERAYTGVIGPAL